MSNIVELKTRRGAIQAAAMAAAPEPVEATADLRALEELQALCAQALAAGGLDAGTGRPTTLDLTVAVHRALKGSEWKVRFYRGQATGL